MLFHCVKPANVIQVVQYLFLDEFDHKVRKKKGTRRKTRQEMVLMTSLSVKRKPSHALKYLKFPALLSAVGSPKIQGSYMP